MDQQMLRNHSMIIFMPWIKIRLSSDLWWRCSKINCDIEEYFINGDTLKIIDSNNDKLKAANATGTET